MLGRRAAARRNRLYRDRGDTHHHPPHHHHPTHPHYHPHHHLHHPTQSPPLHHPALSPAPAPGPTPSPAPPNPAHPVITFTWPDPDARRPSAVLVASFDNHLHHRMHPRTHSHLPPDLAVSLPVPPGRHTYKFFVDGKWSTHPALKTKHPIETSADGVKYHVLVVAQPVHVPTPVMLDHDRLFPDAADGMTDTTTPPTPTTSLASDPHATVFRSASATTVTSAANPNMHHLHAPPSPSMPGVSIAPTFGKPTTSASLPDTSRITLGTPASTAPPTNPAAAAVAAATNSLPVTSPASRLMAPRGSSFNTTSTATAASAAGAPGAPPLSAHTLARLPAEQRKSLLHRVGSGWRRRFSNRGDTAVSATGSSASTIDGAHGLHSGIHNVMSGVAPSPSLSLSRCNFPSPDRSDSGLFRASRDSVHTAAVLAGAVAGLGARQNAALFPSSSEPIVSRSGAIAVGEDKENWMGMQNNNINNNNNSNNNNSGKHHHPIGNGHGSASRSNSNATPDRRRGPLRGSSRSTAVKVSGPTRVDEPRDAEEVNRQADNWRQMARHLQDNLHDAAAARQLLEKAIEHRVKHGLDCSAANAQVHTDLARNLSKADKIAQAEMHLRVALGIYNRLGMGSEHIADLKLYVGVMVDRQKRREEAEDLYRQALEMYKRNEVKGNNMNIAIKNLVLNLKKQNRGHDIVSVYTEYGRCEE